MMIYNIIHGVCGAMTVILGMFNPALAAIFAIMFLVYQLNEEQSLNDRAFNDIREWLIGFGIASGVLIILFIRSIILRGVI